MVARNLQSEHEASRQEYLVWVSHSSLSQSSSASLSQENKSCGDFTLYSLYCSSYQSLTTSQVQEHNMKKLRIIIAGSRTVTSYELIERRMSYLLSDVDTADVQIISGTARGVDQLGERFAKQYGIDLVRMPADWDKHGRSAGYKRNAEMAKVATHAVIFWDGESKGTGHMINLARQHGLHTRVYNRNNQLV